MIATSLLLWAAGATFCVPPPTGEALLLWTPLEAGRGIWEMLPPKTDESVLLLGEVVVARPSTGA